LSSVSSNFARVLGFNKEEAVRPDEFLTETGPEMTKAICGEIVAE
jgi:hypothetical protein